MLRVKKKACWVLMVRVIQSSLPLTLWPRAVSSFMTVKPLAPLPMMAILDLGLGLALRQSAQLHGTGDDMVPQDGESAHKLSSHVSTGSPRGRKA